MSRAIQFTQAQFRRVVKAAESARLSVRTVTVKPNGSITVENGPAIVDSPKMKAAASWDDV